MTSPSLSLEFDPQADAIYVWLATPGTPSHRTETLDDGRVVDYDDRRSPIGVEFLAVTRGIDLADVPEADAIAALLARLPSIKAVA
jgi:uncharacterized protein YuzE